jgi:hypothetical protein
MFAANPTFVEPGETAGIARRRPAAAEIAGRRPRLDTSARITIYMPIRELRRVADNERQQSIARIS